VPKKTRSTHSARAHARRHPLTLALCVIARNEEEFIGQCLDSARPFVDELLVLDTGSTDRTREIAREHGARVVEFVWCDDFAAARNAAIDAATADWILMLDADEQLDPLSGPLLHTLAAELPQDMIGYAVMIENRRVDSASDDWVRHSVSRMFPRRSQLRFVGAIHEDLINLADPSHSRCLVVPAVRVVHYGYDPKIYVARAKDARNTRLLEIELERHPENARVLYFLGQQNFVAGRLAESSAIFARFADVAHEVAPYFLVDAYRMWLEALVALGEEDALERVARTAADRNALSATTREVLARYEMQAGRLGSALRHLLAALKPDSPVGITVAPGIGGWHTRLMLAQLYERMGEPAAALAQMEDAFPALPAREQYEIARQSAQLALLMGEHASAQRWLARASDAASADLGAQQLLLRLSLDVHRRAPDLVPALSLDGALANETWQAAYNAVLETPMGTPAVLARTLYLAGRLREEGAPEAALDVIGRTLDAYPPSAPQYWLLVQILKDLDRFDDALASIEVLRQLPGGEATLRAA
jgi:tetratricopeptide (TPR) repeat protein